MKEYYKAITKKISGIARVSNIQSRKCQIAQLSGNWAKNYSLAGNFPPFVIFIRYYIFKLPFILDFTKFPERLQKASRADLCRER